MAGRPQAQQLLDLSDELLLLIVQSTDRHDDLPSLRLTCKKFRDLSEVSLPFSYPLNTLPLRKEAFSVSSPITINLTYGSLSEKVIVECARLTARINRCTCTEMLC